MRGCTRQVDYVRERARIGRISDRGDRNAQNGKCLKFIQNGHEHGTHSHNPNTT
jgi:hypothetical protein